MAMSIKKDELELIGEYVQSHLSEWLQPQSQNSAQGFYPVELGERFVRVEEELKNQRELMKQGFDHMEKRFEQTDRRLDRIQIDMDKRFEQTDKRLDQIQIEMDKRFEQVDKRFEQVDKRFEQVDRAC